MTSLSCRRVDFELFRRNVADEFSLRNREHVPDGISHTDVGVHKAETCRESQRASNEPNMKNEFERNLNSADRCIETPGVNYSSRLGTLSR